MTPTNLPVSADPAAAAFDAIAATVAHAGPAAAAAAPPPDSAMLSTASLPSIAPSSALPHALPTPEPPSPAMHAPAASQPPPTTADADRVVLEYLRRRGFTAIEEALHQKLTSANPAHLSPSELALDDVQADPDLRNIVMLLRNPADLAEADVRRLHDAYAELRDWVDGSLDVYKPQLHALLYPLLVHSFLEMVRRDRGTDARTFLQRCATEFSNDARADGLTSRRAELLALQAIVAPQHLEENETAQLFLQNRYEIHLSYYAFELVMAFLAEDPRRAPLLRIINQRCRVCLDAPLDTAPGGLIRPRDDAADRKVPGFVAHEERTKLLRSDVLWGRLTPDHYMIADEPPEPDKAGKQKGGKDKPGTAASSKSGDGKTASDPKPGSKTGGAAANSDGPAGAAAKPGADDEEEEAMTRPDGSISKSRVPLKKLRPGSNVLDTAADRLARADLSSRNAVDGLRRDLAVLCYTFTNTRDDGLNCVSVSSDGAQLAGGFGDSTVRVWDARAAGTAGASGAGLTGRALRLVGHAGPVYDVDWTPCGRFVFSASEDGTARLWNPAMRTDLVAYRGHNYPVWGVSVAPYGHYFATGSHDRTARVWATDRMFPLRILAGHLADVDAVRWHPNCNYVATGSSDRTARLWDVRDGKCVRVMPAGGTVHALAFAPDGRTLACGGDAGVVDVWDVASGKRLHRLTGHRSTVWSLDYSRDGAVLASGGADWRVCVWRSEDWCSMPAEAASGKGAGAGEEKRVGRRGDGGDDVGGKDADGNVKMGEADEAKKDGDDGDKEKDKDGGEKSKDGDKPKDGDKAKDKDKENGDERDEGASEGDDGDEGSERVSFLEVFDTKETPIHAVKFTRRNVLVASGPFGG